MAQAFNIECNILHCYQITAIHFSVVSPDVRYSLPIGCSETFWAFTASAKIHFESSTAYRAILHNLNKKKYAHETWTGLVERQRSNPEEWGVGASKDWSASLHHRLRNWSGPPGFTQWIPWLGGRSMKLHHPLLHCRSQQRVGPDPTTFICLRYLVRY